MANYSTVIDIFNHPDVLQTYFQDAITTQNVLIWWLSGKPVDTGAGKKPTAKSMKRIREGGSRWEVPVMLNTNSNLKSYEKDATFNMTVNNVGDRAYYDIKSLGGPIPIYGFDIDVSASSKANILNVTKEYLEQAKLTLANLVQAQILAAAGTAGANDWASLLDIISTSPSTDSIGGISGSANAQWRNQIKTSTGSMATYLKADLDNMMISATFGVEKPTLFVTTPTVYATLKGQLTANQRYVNDSPELAKAGFTGLEYNGVPMIFDSSMTAGVILGIDTNSIEYSVLKGCDMKVDSPVRVPNADMIALFLKHRGNFVVRGRRTSVCGSSFTTA